MQPFPLFPQFPIMPVAAKSPKSTSRNGRRPGDQLLVPVQVREALLQSADLGDAGGYQVPCAGEFFWHAFGDGPVQCDVLHAGRQPWRFAEGRSYGPGSFRGSWSRYRASPAERLRLDAPAVGTEQRTLASGSAQAVAVTSQQVTFDEYLAGDIPAHRILSHLAGEARRLEAYAATGLIDPGEPVPAAVLDASRDLQTAGFSGRAV